MGGGSSKGGGSKSVSAPSFNTTGFANTGYNQTPSPFTAQGKPSWMQGHFANDAWGKAAADPRISLTQDMMSPYGAPIVNEAVSQMGQYDQQMAQGQNPQMPQWMSQLGGQPMSLDQARAMGRPPATGKAAPQQIAQGNQPAPEGKYGGWNAGDGF